MIVRLLTTLIPTILIELGVLVLLREKRRKVLWASVAMNVATNVPLNIWAEKNHPQMSTIIIAELAVIIMESLCYYAVTRNIRLSAVYSLLCNAMSFLLGLLFCLIVMWWKAEG